MGSDATSPTNSTIGSAKRLGFVYSVSVIWSICKKQAMKASRKLATNARIAPKPKSPSSSFSPMARPKKLLANISHKAIRRSNSKKFLGGYESPAGPKSSSAAAPSGDDESLDFGDGGLWQRNILMGDKCDPLNFSGVIFYDSEGKRLDEFPGRSPRASPLPSNFFVPSSPAKK